MLKRDTSVCPYCGSEDIYYSGLDDGGGDYGESIVELWKCEDCQMTIESSSLDWIETEDEE